MNDESTLASLHSPTGDDLPVIPALTILWHPEPHRIGETAPLEDAQAGHLVAFRRDTPSFGPPATTSRQPVAHRCVSRETAFTLRATPRGYELAAGPAPTSLMVNGQPLEAPRGFTLQELGAGVTLAIGKSLALCLHTISSPVARSPLAELLGSGDGIEQIRRSIQRAADQEQAVLIRGETGTGKELVAQALHRCSRRRQGPFVAVNMSTVRPERAAADLFGHEKGAFTGATETRPGFFRAAHGGTLLLDEIGAAPPEVQQMLLRVLQDRTVQAVGATTGRTVDVRIVAATDARIEEAMIAGKFAAPLYHRLSALRIDVPPLRERREDFGLLLVHFLTRELAARGELSRLSVPSAPWLPAPLVARLALGPWPGNVRQLQNLASQLAALTSDRSAEEIAKPYLPDVLPAPSLLSTRSLSRDQLLEALDRRHWNQSQAAKDLQISRETLRKIVGKEPQLRKVIELPLATLLQEQEQVKGDLAEVSRRLGIDERLLRRRLRARS